MTFKDVVFKNFLGNIKKYYAYFLSGSFSIMLFFMYATLIFNKDLKGREDTQVLSYVFPITMVAIALFSVFFINYAHTAFMKGRNKEFGIYISLGLNAKELRNMINIESLIINLGSFLVGVTIGTLFSRLFQMVILSLLEIRDIRFSLDYRPFIVSFLVFFLIFGSVTIRTMFRMRKLDITSLLQEERKSEGRGYRKSDPILGGLGLFIMVCSVLMLVVIANNDKLNANPLVLMIYMGSSFLGMYLTLSCGGNLIMQLYKKSRFYYENMLTATQLHHKFNQNKKIIFILSVLSTMTIFLVASPFSLFSLSESIAEMATNHLEYVETSTINHLEEEKLDDILKNQGVDTNRSIKFIYLSTKENSNQLSDCKPVISASEYNQLTGSSVVVERNKVLNIILDWVPGNHGIMPGNPFKLYAEGRSYEYQVQNSHRGNWIGAMSTFPSNSVIIMEDEDYQKVLSDVSERNTGYYHLINFKNWKKSGEAVKELKAALGRSELSVFSILDNYKSLRNGYSVFLFVSTVMGIMFFVAGGSVLYFKQFTELSQAKIVFYKLFKIGITDKEMKSVIAKELFIVFFLPLLFGTFFGTSLIYLMTYIVGGDAIIGEFIRNAFVVVGIYFASQSVFYLITRSKYIGEIVKL